MTNIRIAGVAGAGMMALLALSGCEVQGGPPVYGPGPGPDLPIYGPGSTGGPRACPRIYDPVCGDRFGNQRSFPNSCEADSAGYRIAYGGQCRSSRPGSGDFGGRPGPGDNNGRPGQASGRMCPMIYKPVCGQRGSDTRTFPNSCQAEGDGYRVIYESECRGGGSSGGGHQGRDDHRDGNADRHDSGDRQHDAGNRLETQRPGNGQSCSRAYVPVCGERGGDKKTFLNACLAQSEGYRVADNGKCQ